MLSKKIKTIFIGTPDFGVPALNSLIKDEFFEVVGVITQPDKKIGRKQTISIPPIKQEAKKFDIPVFQPDKLKNFAEEIKKIEPDVIVVAAYAQILPGSILDLPKYGSINIHGSLLPKYRGSSCIQAAILNGDKETGITIMKMDVGLDTGDIIKQFSIPIEKTDTFETLFKKLSNLAGEVTSNTIKMYIGGELAPSAQDNRRASLTKNLKKEDGNINWQKNADEIERFVRAMYPWPIAFAFYKNKKIQILKVKSDILKINRYKIGQVFQHEKKIIAVQCGKDALVLESVKMEGKKEIGALAFSLGNKDFIGTILG